MDTGFARYEAFLAEVQANCKRIVVIGDFIQEHYHEGTLGGTGCQESRLTLETTRTWDVLGGAGNVAQQLMPWNVEVHSTLVGGGNHAIHRFLAEARLILVEAIDGERRPVCKSVEEYFAVCRYNGYADGILAADYGKGGIPADLATEIVTVAQKNKVPLVVSAGPSPEGDRDHRWDGATVVKMSRGQWLRRAADAKLWIKEHKVTALVITRGELPPQIVSNDPRDPLALSDRPCVWPLIDDAGAGDHFAAVLAVGIVHGLPVSEAAEFAHEATKVRIAHRRPRLVFPEEVRVQFDLAGEHVAESRDWRGAVTLV